MSTVPENRLERIEFYEVRIDPWTLNAAAIGLTAAQVNALSELVAQARAAYNASEAARAAAKAATQTFYETVRAMHSGPGAGQDMIDAIRNFAETNDDPKVYGLAQIPPPATPGSTPPPGTPFAFRVGLLQSGAVELKWKANNPKGASGTIYEVRRRVGSAGAFSFVGATGTRSFIDDTLPAGSAAVTYQIVGVRSTSRGNPGQFTVSFGVGGGGGLTIQSVSESTTPVKMVA